MSMTVTNDAARPTGIPTRRRNAVCAQCRHANLRRPRHATPTRLPSPRIPDVAVSRPVSAPPHSLGKTQHKAGRSGAGELVLHAHEKSEETKKKRKSNSLTSAFFFQKSRFIPMFQKFLHSVREQFVFFLKKRNCKNAHAATFFCWFSERTLFTHVQARRGDCIKSAVCSR